MATFLLILHVIVCLFLIFIVLIQGGKGADMGAAFGGGSSQTVFGGRGAATFLSKLTTGVAVVFMITSLLLAIVSVRGGSIVRDQPSAPASAVPPAASTAPGGGSPVPFEIPQQPLAPSEPPAK